MSFTEGFPGTSTPEGEEQSFEKKAPLSPVELKKQGAEGTRDITEGRKKILEKHAQGLGPDDDPDEVDKINGQLELNTRRNTEAEEELRGLEEIEEVKNEGLKAGLEEKELGIIVDADYDKILDLPKERQEAVYETLEGFEKKGIIDSEAETGFGKALSKILQGILNKLDSSGNGVGYSGDISGLDINNPKIKEVVQAGMSQVGKHENSRETDKFFKETGHNCQTNKVPWCAAYVNWCLKQAGIQGTGSNAAKSFIGGSGFGHVGFKVNDGLLGGNQSDQVCVKPLNTGKVAGWILPTDIPNGGPVIKNASNIPDGAIVVYNRSTTKKSDKQYG